jgi:hypothetical protein
MTESSSTATAPHRWTGLDYQQVPGLANRIISRYLRSQRKNMLRFFTERGMFDLAERMRRIKLSRQGMLAKNQMFQKVLNEYSERVTPKGTEATPPLTERNLVLSDPHRAAPESASEHTELDDGVRSDAGRGVSAVASEDGGMLIEE